MGLIFAAAFGVKMFPTVHRESIQTAFKLLSLCLHCVYAGCLLKTSSLFNLNTQSMYGVNGYIKDKKLEPLSSKS